MRHGEVEDNKKTAQSTRGYPKNERDVIVSSVAPKHQGRDKVEKIV